MRALLAHGGGVERAIAGRDLEERSVLRALFNVGEFGSHLPVSGLDGEVKFLVDPDGFLFAALLGDFPLIAGAAIDGLGSYLFAGCILVIAKSAGIALEVLPFGRALRHGTVGIGGEFHE